MKFFHSGTRFTFIALHVAAADQAQARVAGGRDHVVLLPPPWRISVPFHRRSPRTWRAPRSRSALRTASPIPAAHSLPTRPGSADPRPCRCSSAGCARRRAAEELPQALAPTIITPRSAPSAQSIFASLIGSSPPRRLYVKHRCVLLRATRAGRGDRAAAAPAPRTCRGSVSARPASRRRRARRRSA